MPRIRYLKPEFFSDEDLAELSFQTRIFFAGLWCYADKAGRLEDRPKYLKAMIFPYDNIDVEKQLQILSKPKHGNGLAFIARYQIEDKKYIEILSWDKHQKPHHTESESKIPPYPPNGEGKDKGNGECQTDIAPSNNGYKDVKKPLKTEVIKINDFIASLKENPAYKGIDIDNELHKMDAWLSIPRNKGRKKTERFIINWLNKIDKPVEAKSETKKPQQTDPTPTWIKEAVKEGWKG